MNRTLLRVVLSLACAISLGTPLSTYGASFIRDGTDGNLEIGLTDGVRILGFLFGGRPKTLECMAAADCDANAEVELTDGVYLLNFLFLGQSPPPAPFPDCGAPLADDLSCETYPNCSPPPACIDADALARLTAANTPRNACIPPSTPQVLTLQLSFCSEAAGPPSDEGQEPTVGCAVEISVLGATADLASQLLQLSIQGGIADTPLKVVDLIGTETTCNVQASFEATANIPVVGEVSGPAFEITGLGVATLADVTFTLNASGGELCSLLQGASALFSGDLATEVEAAINENLGSIAEAISHSRVCLSTSE
jgi:hypothetical protein